MSDALKDILFVATIAGLHPESQNLFAHFRTFIIFLTLISSCVSILYTTYTIADFKSVSAATEATPIIYQALSKLFSFKFGMKGLKRLFDNLNLLIQPESLNDDFKTKILINRKKLRKFFLIYCFLIFCSLLFYVLKPIFARNRSFALNWYPICDYSNIICYVGVNCSQVFHAVVYLFIITTADGAFIILGFRLVEQFTILKYHMRELSAEKVKPPEEYLAKLYRLVDQHNIVLKFIKWLNDSYYMILLDQFWSTFVAVCVGLFLFTVEGFPPTLMTTFKYVSFTVVLLVQLFIFSQVGNLIADECDGFGFEAYNLNWHQTPNKDIKVVVRRIIHSSNNAFRMNIGKILPLNLETFMLVVKNAVSFYTLLQTLYKGPTGI